jgi:hypothetical protein
MSGVRVRALALAAPVVLLVGGLHAARAAAATTAATIPTNLTRPA